VHEYSEGPNKKVLGAGVLEGCGIEFMDMQRRLRKFTFKCVSLRCEKRLLVAGKVPQCSQFPRAAYVREKRGKWRAENGINV